MSDPEWAIPHQRELVEAFSREYGPQHKVAYLECADADVAVVVATQSLLVPGRADDDPVLGLLHESEVVLP
jgi:hypothetical protein